MTLRPVSAFTIGAVVSLSTPSPAEPGAESREHLVSAGHDGTWSPLSFPVANGLPPTAAVQWVEGPQWWTFSGELDWFYETNDNLTRSAELPVQESISSQRLWLDAKARLSPHTTLRLSGGLGADTYLDHPELIGNGEDTQFYAAPGTTRA